VFNVAEKVVNARAGVPSQADLFTSNYILHSIDRWPAAIEDGKRLGALGFGVPGEAELDMPHVIASHPPL
jgi:hypothetical protein